MNFDFGPDQYMIQESVRGFLADRWSPAQLRALMEGDGADPELWRGLTELGLPGMLVPDAQGGLGLSFVDLALVLEEFGRALVPGPMVEAMLAADVIARFGMPEQQASLLPAIAEGTCRIVPAVTEAEAGCDPELMQATASEADNGWTLSGRKILVPYAGLADTLLVAARFGPSGQPGLALVDPNGKGVTRRPHALFDLASRADEVVFDAAPAEVLGKTPSAASLSRLLDAGAAAAALQMTGIAGRMLELAVEYAGQRVQFGRPIGAFQAIKHRCADMMVQVETSRTAAYYAAWALAAGPAEAPQAVSMAKAYCGDAARDVCNEAIQIHGGVGFAWELDLHLYLRRAKSLEFAYGEASLHRERVIAAALLARDAA